MRKSFTLIELLIVIIIIGILATLAIPQYQKLMDKVRITQAKQLVSALADSAWRRYLETREFPHGTGGPISLSADQFDISVQAPNGFSYTCNLGESGDQYLSSLGCQILTPMSSGAHLEYRITFCPKSLLDYEGFHDAEKQSVDDNYYKIYYRFDYNTYGGVVNNWQD